MIRSPVVSPVPTGEKIQICCEMHVSHACHMHEPGTDARIRTCDLWWAAHIGAAHICNIVWCICLSNKIGHHARPRRASATAPLRTGADTNRSSALQDAAPERAPALHAHQHKGRMLAKEQVKGMHQTKPQSHTGAACAALQVTDLLSAPAYVSTE